MTTGYVSQTLKLDRDTLRTYLRSWTGDDGKYTTLFEWEPSKVVYQRYIDRRSGEIRTAEHIVPGRYKKHRSKRDLGWHNYTLLARTIDQAPYYPWWDKNHSSPSYWYSITEPLPFTSNDLLRLEGDIADAAAGHSFNMAVANAQDHLTVEMVAGTVRRFTKSIRYLRHGDIPSAVRALAASPRGDHAKRRPPPLTTKDVSDMWLELRYGWEPLLSDVHESMSAYAAVYEKPRSMQFRVKLRKSLTRDDWLIPTYNIADRRKYSNLATIICELTETLSTPRALGLYDPASVIWEITPFSFVADWFVPIGTYLHALNTIPFLEGRFLKTVRRRVKSETFYAVGAYSGARCNFTYTRMERAILYSLPVPRPQFKPIKNALSLRHLENGLALLRSVLL